MTSESNDLFKELQEKEAIGRGFDSKEDMNRMICRIDCDRQNMLHSFQIWNDKKGTKEQLTKIIQGKGYA